MKRAIGVDIGVVRRGIDYLFQTNGGVAIIHYDIINEIADMAWIDIYGSPVDRYMFCDRMGRGWNRGFLMQGRRARRQIRISEPLDRLVRLQREKIYDVDFSHTNGEW